MSFMQMAKLRRLTKAKEAVVQNSRLDEEESSVISCTKSDFGSKPVTVQPNVAVVSKPTNVEVGPAKVEKQEYNKNLLQGDKVDEWDNLVQLVGVNVNSALSKSTNDQYNFWWKKFLEFCAKFERESSPFCVLTAVAFFSWLAEQSNGVGGVDQARAALKHYHNKNFPGLSCPTDNVQVSSVLKGIKRRFAKPVEKKKPLAPQDFSKLLSFIVGEDFSLLKMVDLRFAAQVSLMYCTFSRFEESVGLHVHHVVEEDGFSQFSEG